MTIGTYFFGLFKIWIDTLFVLPFKNFEMLWLLVPIWIAWFFAEFFQEKVGTSMGNAITNAVVILWGSIDCTRQTVSLISKNLIHSTLEAVGRFCLVLILFIYGAVIVHLGLKGNKVIKKIGKVRIVTYVFAMFVPVFYNAINFSFEHFLASVLFFPLFYFVIELLDRLVPDPKALQLDMEEGENQTHKHHQPQENSISQLQKEAYNHSRELHRNSTSPKK